MTLSFAVREREQSRGEELANSISHGIGLVAALVATPLLVLQAVRREDAGFIVGASVFRACVTAVENMPMMRRVTVAMRSMSTPWKTLGCCCVPGCARIGVSRTKSYRCPWASLSAYITSDTAVGLCWDRG